MKCNHPKCKRDKKKYLGITSTHPVFGDVCEACYAEYQDQILEVAAKVRRKYGKPAKRKLEVSE